MRKVRVAVIGVGVHGRLHALKYSQSPRAELVAVVDIDEAAACETAARTGARAVSDYREILSEIDAVSVVVPVQSHYAVARDCLMADLDVLVEKPITLALADADDLISLAQRKQRILQVGHIERFNPAVCALAPRVETPRYLSCSRIVPGSYRTVGIDVVRDLMIHDIDLACWLIGRPVIDIESCGASLTSDTLDLVQARLRFEGGCIADLFASRAGGTPERSLRLLQDGGCACIDFMSSSLHWLYQEGASVAAGQVVAEAPKADALATELDAFLHCVQTRSQPMVDGHAGRNALAIALTIGQGVEQLPMPAVPNSAREPTRLSF